MDSEPGVKCHGALDSSETFPKQVIDSDENVFEETSRDLNRIDRTFSETIRPLIERIGNRQREFISRQESRRLTDLDEISITDVDSLRDGISRIEEWLCLLTTAMENLKQLYQPDDSTTVHSTDYTEPKEPVYPVENTSTDTTGRVESMHADMGKTIIENQHFAGDQIIHMYAREPEYPSYDTIVLNLQQQLNERAKKVAKEIRIPIKLDKAIKAVRLQITTETQKSPEALDNEGHFIRRREYRTIFDTPKGNIAISGLFETAENNAKIEANKMYTTDKDKLNYVETVGGAIMITGQAGIGKTVLSKMLTNEVLNHKILPQTDFLFYIQFRDIDFQSKKNIIEFLLVCSGCPSDDGEADKLIWRAIKENPNVVLIMDGLDEAATTDFRQHVPKCNPMKATKVSVITGNILNRTLLSKCRLAITSRPRQAHELHIKNKPRIEFQVVGLDADAKENLGEQISGAEWAAVKDYFDQHADIYAICYVPVICIVTIHCVHSKILLGEEIELDTVTSVLAYGLDKYARSEHLRENVCGLTKLCLLAWNGFSNQRITFTEKDFRDAEIDTKSSGAFLATYIKISTDMTAGLMEGDKVSCFSHLIWQELLTAIYIMYFMPVDQFKENLKFLTESRWEVVARSMFGITNPITKRCLDTIFDRPDNVVFDEKVQNMKEFAHTATQQLGDDFEGDELVRMLQVCTWAKEANDVQFAASLSLYFPDKINLSGDVLPGDITSLMFVLRSNQHGQQVINVGSGTRFKPSTCLQKLLQEIAENNITMEILNLSPSTNVTDSIARSVAQCFSNINKLTLGKSGISETGLQLFADGLSERQQQIQELNLRKNLITDLGALHIARCLNKVNRLDVSKCGISDAGFQHLSRGIMDLSNPMEFFDISHSAIGDNGAKALGNCVQNIRKFCVEKCEITDFGIEKICDGIARLSVPMEEVKFARNPINTRSAIAISKCIQNIDNLHVRKCKINDLAAEHLAYGVKQRQTKMKMLNVTYNPEMGDTGAVYFCESLKNLEAMRIWMCGITRVGYRRLQASHKRLTPPRTKVWFGEVEGYEGGDTVLEPE